jgi:hypothetical protein
MQTLPRRPLLLVALLSVFCFALPGSGWAQMSVAVDGLITAADDERIERALMLRGSLELAEVPLRQAVAELQQKFHVPMILATKKLEEAGVSPDTPLSISVPTLPLGSVLRLMLKPVELTFSIRDGVVLITTPEDAEGQLLTRVYPVLDLVTGKRVTSPKTAAAFTVRDYDSLIELIKATVSPDSWDDVGGPGAIDCLDNAGSLVVSQTYEVQSQVAGLLTALRQSRGIQGIPSLPAPPLVSRAVILEEPLHASSRDGERASGALIGAAASAGRWQVPQVHAAGN